MAKRSLPPSRTLPAAPVSHPGGRCRFPRRRLALFPPFTPFTLFTFFTLLALPSLFTLLLPTPSRRAAAHDFGVSYSRIELSANSINIDISINVDELPPLVRLDDDGSGYIEEHEVSAHRADIARFFENGIRITKDDRPCKAKAGPVTYNALKTAAESTIHFSSPPGPGRVRVTYAFVPTFLHPHRNVATVVLGSQQRTFLFSADSATLTVRLVGNEIAAEEAQESGGGSLFRAGLRTFVTRIDLPVVALLFALSAPTAIALLGAAHFAGALLLLLGLVTVPATPLQAALALAIAYVAAENWLGKGTASSRWMLALPVGLLSGSTQARALSRAVAVDALPLSGSIAFALAGALAMIAATFALHAIHRQLQRSSTTPPAATTPPATTTPRRNPAWALLLLLALAYFVATLLGLPLPGAAAA